MKLTNSCVLDQDWKHSCYVHCLAPVLEAVSQPNLEYANVLALDNRIRGFSVPQPFKHANLQGRALVMQKGSLATAQEARMSECHDLELLLIGF